MIENITEVQMKDDFYRILKEHTERYPNMRPKDYGKLIFQSEFGPEHMVLDKDSVLSYLKEERQHLLEESTPKQPEDIGGGLCRFPLSSCPPETAAESLLADLFVLTARERRGSTEGVLAKLKILNEFHIPGMEPWAKHWIGQNHPPIHHSRAYKESYHPHYRLLQSEYAGSFSTLLEIKRRMEMIIMAKQKRHIVVGIDGRCGSGKTRLAELIQTLFDCNVIHMDDFYLPPGRRKERWMEMIGGNMDFERLKSEIFEPLKKGGSIEYRPFCCQTGVLSQAVQMQPKALTVVEGTYSHHPFFGMKYDIAVFLDCSKEEQKRRLMEREGEYYSVFEKCWIPMEERYFAVYNGDMEIFSALLAQAGKKC